MFRKNGTFTKLHYVKSLFLQISNAQKRSFQAKKKEDIMKNIKLDIIWDTIKELYNKLAHI